MQTQVNIFQAVGMAGEFFSDALKSVTPKILNGVGYTAAVKATGSITLTEVPTLNDTISIGDQEYTFVTEADQATFLVTIGADVTTTAATLASAINATNPFVSATSALGVVTLTARVGGVAANSIVIATSNSDQTVTGMSGGIDVINANNAKIGNAFTIVDANTAIMGGTGAFAGIFVNPKNQTIYNNLTATLEVPDGTVGSLARSGYFFVTLSNSSVAGSKVYFTNATGVLSAGTASVGQTQILGAQILDGGAAGSVVKMGLIPQTA